MENSFDCDRYTKLYYKLLKADAERSIVSDLPAARFAYTEMPDNFEVEDFMASWND